MPILTRKPRVPGYRRKVVNGREYAVVSLGGWDVYLGEYGSVESHQQYEHALAEWLAGGRRRIERTEPAPFSVNELILAYLGWAEAYHRGRDGQPDERQIYHVRRALRPLREMFGLSEAAAFGPRKLEVVRERFVGEGLCRSMVNRYCARIKHLFKWGAAKELVPAATWHGLQALEGLKRGRTEARETEPIRPVADHLVDAIKPHVARPVWAMIELQRLTGMRPGEVCIMRGCDLDTTGSLWEYRPAFHKTEHAGKQRAIVLGPKAQAVIHPFLRHDLSEFLFSPREADEERRAALSAKRVTPLSCGNRPGSNSKRRPKKQPGLTYDVASYRHAISYGCGRAFPPPDGLSEAEQQSWRRDHKWHPNQLRHAAATRIRREFGLDAAQVVLGHSQADVTQLYAEKDLQLASAVALKIG